MQLKCWNCWMKLNRCGRNCIAAITPINHWSAPMSSQSKPIHRRKALRAPHLTESMKFRKFLDNVIQHTPFLKMLGLLIALWLFFSTALYFAENGIDKPVINSFGEALYWGITAFSTAGIADTPASGTAQLIGGIWIVLGSVLFFGTIVASITAYFMRPLQRPDKQIIDTIEYNLEHLDDLSVDELDLLKETADTLILHMERIKQRR